MTCKKCGIKIKDEDTLCFNCNFIKTAFNAFIGCIAADYKLNREIKITFDDIKIVIKNKDEEY